MGDLFSTGIRPAVDAWLLAKSKETRDYGDYWSASQAGYCMRKVIFERLGVPHVETEADARKQRVFTSGHIFHQWMQEITKESGLSIAQELELQDESLMIRGHIDDLVLVEDREYVSTNTPLVSDPTQEMHPLLKIKQHLILMDYKTRNSKNFNYAKQPSYFHRLQLGTYMYMLRRGGSIVNGKEVIVPIDEIANLTEARTLNIEKDTLRMAEVQYMWSPELEKDVLDYWNTLNKYWKEKRLPKCTCHEQANGFMAKAEWNPFYWNEQPCSLEWYTKWKEQNDSKPIA